MKKKISVFLSCVFIFLVAILFTFNNYYASKEVIINEKKSYLNTDNMMSMMYETSSGSDEYMVASDNTWPQEGYVFNERLSGCENGGKLIWDDERKTVTLSTNVSDKCYLYFDKYNVATINSVTVSDSSSESITLTVNATAGQNAIEKYYYSVDDSEYTETNSNVITINGLTSSTEYSISIYAVDSAGQKSNTYTMTASTSDNTALAGLIENLYTSDGENGLYYHDGQGTYGAQEAGDNSYRYSGANPNNYVCFGPGAETEGTCANDNLYRIIGIFDDDKDGNYQIKLIKSDYVTSDMLGTDGRDYDGAYSFSTSNYKGSMNTSTIAVYRWNYDTNVDSMGSNNWATSEFNIINLNTNYWNYLGGTWQKLIAITTWHLGGMTSDSNTAKAFYDGEKNNTGYGSNPTIYTDEIGLMYASDYGYAANPNAWVTNLNSYSNSTIKSNNWLYIGLDEWTITPLLEDNTKAAYLHNNGNVNDSHTVFSRPARPAFYLKSNVILEGGTGTKSSPYRLSIA